MKDLSHFSKRHLVADSECVGLLPSVRPGHQEDVHIITLTDLFTDEEFVFFNDFEHRVNAVWLDELEDSKYGTIADAVFAMEICDTLILQNISGFDAMALEKTYGFYRDHFTHRESEVFPFPTADTYVMSTLLNPERRLPPQAYATGLGNTGPHSIAAHGIRMGRYKPDHEDWSTLTADMVHRNREDVAIGKDFFFFLMKEWNEQMERTNSMTNKSIEDAYLQELRFAFTMCRQAERGFAFDVEFVSRLIPELDKKIQETIDNFRPNMPQRICMKKLSEEQCEVNAIETAKLAIKLGYPGDSALCASDYENYMINGDQRASKAVTYWELTTKNGKYKANITKYIPEARGFYQDFSSPPVAGPFTPLVWEDIPLGNRDEVKQILHKYGWVGVNYNDAELAYLEENGEIPFPWSGKIDDDSIEKWEQSGSDVPEWCKGIADWYVLVSRRNQLLNIKDPAYFEANKVWPTQSGGNGKFCRGLLPRAICQEGEFKGWTAQDYFAKKGAWPDSGHWRVPAIAIPIGTNTFRCRHKVVVNIPSRGLYGKEMRRCFIAGPGKMILGCDGAGLELRMLAHFMDDPEYTDVILNGDVHSCNQEKAGLSTRNLAKTFIYAFLYGSGIPNLARQLGLPEYQMEEAVARFKKELPHLTELLQRVERAGKKFGYLLSIDGRRGRIRYKGNTLSLHTALNVLLQMTGSLIMKWSHMHAEDEAVALGIISCIEEFPIIAHMHDEGQMEIEESEVESEIYDVPESAWKDEEKREHIDAKGRMWSAPSKLSSEGEVLKVIRYYHPLGEVYCKSITWAGEHFGLRCPTAGEYKIGKSWLDTH